eukprot:Amastigsp_a181299_3.p4 type:complete len:114 gc:universal Amastigsp_a181299_3:1026-685(-)
MARVDAIRFSGNSSMFAKCARIATNVAKMPTPKNVENLLFIRSTSSYTAPTSYVRGSMARTCSCGVRPRISATRARMRATMTRGEITKQRQMAATGARVVTSDTERMSEMTPI